MNSGTSALIFNGKELVTPNGINVAETRKLQPSLDNAWFFVEDPTVGTKLMAEQDRLEAGQRHWTIPHIVKA